METNFLIDGPESADVTFIFAHGAGAGMDHDFMARMAGLIAGQGIRVVRFNFPYMAKRALDGKKRPPDRAPKLLEHFENVIAEHGRGKVVIGGKSMGGRMASLLHDREDVTGIVCMGFPFHPPGKPENFKGGHLADMDKPCLILQGERDTFGKRSEVAEFVLSESVRVEFVPDGDHSFKPRKVSGHTEQENLMMAADKTVAFIREVTQ
ncbi:alpha/beta fold hydrolase [Parasalinivibrio latis]|uniref:alpha/beta fold hydrolase n=1 Tax=Parasalinivibrio latis TaxID=2952610 RepID=UPI0030DF429C